MCTWGCGHTNDTCKVGMCVGVCKDGVGVSAGRAQGSWRCSWCCTWGSVGVQGWGLQCPGAALLDPGAVPPPGLQLLPVELWERLYQHRAESKGWAALAHAPVSSGQGQGISLLSLERPGPCPWPCVYSLFWGGADTPGAAEGPAAGEPQLPLWASWQLWGEGAPCPWPPPVWWALRGAPAIGGRRWWWRSPHQCWHQGLCVQRSLSHGHSGMGTALGSCIPPASCIPPGAGGPHGRAIVVAVPV